MVEPNQKNSPNNNASPIYAYTTLALVVNKHTRSAATSVGAPRVAGACKENTVIIPSTSCARKIGGRTARTARRCSDIA